LEYWNFFVHRKSELEATHLKHAAELLESETNLTAMLSKCDDMLLGNVKQAKEMEDVKYTLHDTLKTLERQAATLQHANAWTTQSRRNSEQYTIQKQKLMAEIATLRARIKPLTQCPQIARQQPIDEFSLNMAVHKIKSLIDAVNEAAGKRIINMACGKQML
jgi:hypothetical protein